MKNYIHSCCLNELKWSSVVWPPLKAEVWHFAGTMQAPCSWVNCKLHCTRKYYSAKSAWQLQLGWRWFYKILNGGVYLVFHRIAESAVKTFPHVCTFLPFLPAFQNEPFEWDSFQLHLPFLASPRQDCSLKNKIQWDSTINFQRGVLLGWRIYSIWNHTYISHGQTGLELEPIWSSSYLFLCN